MPAIQGKYFSLGTKGVGPWLNYQSLLKTVGLYGQLPYLTFPDFSLSSTSEDFNRHLQGSQGHENRQCMEGSDSQFALCQTVPSQNMFL